MPEMDGRISTSKIKEYIQKEKLADVPIIACSAFDSKTEINSFL